MYKLIIVVLSLLVFVACGENAPSQPEVTIEPVKRVTYITWQAAQRDNGDAGTADGYKVYCAPIPGYQPVIGVDVGDITKYPLTSVIMIDGLWYCSVAPYDATREYERQGEASVKRNNGEFYLP